MVGTAQVRLCPPYEALPAPRIDRGEFAPAQQQQPRGQSAAAGDPFAHRRRIGCLAPRARLPARHTSGRGCRSSARREIPAPRGGSRRSAPPVSSSAPACRPTGTARRSPPARRIGAPDRTVRETVRPLRRGSQECESRPARAGLPRTARLRQRLSLMTAIRMRGSFVRRTALRPSYAEICGKVSSILRAGDAGLRECRHSGMAGQRGARPAGSRPQRPTLRRAACSGRAADPASVRAGDRGGRIRPRRARRGNDRARRDQDARAAAPLTSPRNRRAAPEC